MKAARDMRLEYAQEYKYDKVKREERKKTKELRDKKKTRHNHFISVD